MVSPRVDRHPHQAARVLVRWVQPTSTQRGAQKVSFSGGPHHSACPWWAYFASKRPGFVPVVQREQGGKLHFLRSVPRPLRVGEMAGALCGWRLQNKSANAAATSYVPQWSLFGTPPVVGVVSGGWTCSQRPPFWDARRCRNRFNSACTVSGDGSVYGPTTCSCRCLGGWAGGNATRGRSLIAEPGGAGRAGGRRGLALAVRALV